MSRTILACFAHPDDETFLAGPLLARYAAEGVRVELVCGTPPEGAAGTRAAARRSELECAASVIGIAGVRFLGYADYSMRASAADERGMLAAAPLEELARFIVAVMEEVEPDVVVTDSQYGAYGHPDHVVMHRATAAAFESVLKPKSKLYALAYPLPLVWLVIRSARLFGVNPRKVGPAGAIDLVAAVATALSKSAVIDARDHVAIRRAASRCYATEIADAPLFLRLIERLPLFAHRRIFGKPSLSRLWPPPDGFERDLFGG